MTLYKKGEGHMGIKRTTIEPGCKPICKPDGDGIKSDGNGCYPDGAGCFLLSISATIVLIQSSCILDNLKFEYIYEKRNRTTIKLLGTDGHRKNGWWRTFV